MTERFERWLTVECVCGEDFAVDSLKLDDGAWKCTNPKCNRRYYSSLLKRLANKAVVRREAIQKSIKQ